jgi:hypothetical protein
MLTQDQLNTIKMLSKSQRDYDDNCKLVLTLGHYFNWNVAVTLANSYNIQGKATLNADAMIGALRRHKDDNGNKICGGFTVLHSDDESCTMQAIRLDEQKAALNKAKELNKPLLIALDKATDVDLIKYILNMISSNNTYASQAGIHTYTFNMAHAKQRGKDKDRAWRQMPKNMLQKRCATALARQAFPEIIGVTYSPDELAEMVIKDEAERDAIVYASAFGERAPSKPPAHVPAPAKKKVNSTSKQVTKQPKEVATANPYPRLYNSVNMTASEALSKLDTLTDDQVNKLANETQGYLAGCTLGDNPKAHVKVALTKLKVKEFQLTIDLVHQVAAKHGNFNDDVSSQVVEYIVSFDPKQDITCYDMYDMLKSMI